MQITCVSHIFFRLVIDFLFLEYFRDIFVCSRNFIILLLLRVECNVCTVNNTHSIIFFRLVVCQFCTQLWSILTFCNDWRRTICTWVCGEKVVHILDVHQRKTNYYMSKRRAVHCSLAHKAKIKHTDFSHINISLCPLSTVNFANLRTILICWRLWYVVLILLLPSQGKYVMSCVEKTGCV